MNLDLFRTRNESEDPIFSTNKNSETFNKQVHRKPQETLECKLTQPREVFSFKQSINLGVDSKWMIGLLKLVDIIRFLLQQQKTINLNFLQMLSLTDLRDEVADILTLSRITNKNLQDESMGCLLIKTYKRQASKSRQTDGYYIIFLAQA